MLIKSLAAGLLLALLHTGACASIITLNVWGVIATEAIDRSAMFGPIRADLNGKEFMATVRYERPRRTDFSNLDTDVYDAQLHGAGPVDFSITINNRTLTRQFVPTLMAHTVMDSANTFADWIEFYTYTGNVENGVAFSFRIYNFVDALIPPHPRLESPISWTVDDRTTPWGSVWLRPGSRSHGNLEFNMLLHRLEVSATDVPEPGGVLLMLAALGAAGLALGASGRKASAVVNARCDAA